MRRSGKTAGLVVTLAAALLLGVAPAVAQAPSPDADAELMAAIAQVELMNAVPAGIRETCMPASGDPPEIEGIVATVQCLHGNAIALYVRFDSEDSLRIGYDFLGAFTGLSPDSGTACHAGAFEGEYSAADGSVGGRLICQLGPDGPMAMWTDSAELVLGVVQVVGEGSFSALEDAWLAARLDAESVAAATSPAPAATAVAPAAASPPPATDGPAPVGGDQPLSQWASAATASSQYSDDSWSAMQATGAPDAPGYGDSAHAWAPAQSDAGQEWIELTYDTPVIPSEVVIWETSGNGFVRFVEGYDPASGWFTLWQGADDSPPQVHGFSPPLAASDIAIDRLRISIDTTVPGWNEIDAVELSGVVPEEP